MRRRHGLNLGWIDSSIGTLLRTSDGFSSRFAYALITCIDSSRDVSTFLSASTVIKRNRGARALGDGLLVPADHVAELMAEFNFFTGFDEIWWFDTEPT